jgi:hypothetical protein
VKIPREVGRALFTPRRVESLPRAARAYLAGFGTSGSLLAVAVLLFIVASALVAFRGWPHVGAQPSPGEVVVSPRPTAATSSVAARRLVAISAVPAAAPTVPVVAGGVGRGLRGPGAPGTRRSIGSAASTSVPAGAPVVVGAVPAGGSHPVPACLTGCGAAPAVPSAPRPVQQLQQTAQQATGTLGNVVSGTGGKVSSSVQRTTSAAAGAVAPVSPPAATAVKSAGSGAGNVVGGVTKTTSGALSAIGSGH